MRHSIRVPRGTDLGRTVKEAFRTLGYSRMRVAGEGTLASARLVCHDQRRMEWFTADFPGPLEILSLDGEVILRDGVMQLRIHLVLTGPDGRGIGGLLVEGGVPADDATITLDPA